MDESTETIEAGACDAQLNQVVAGTSLGHLFSRRLFDQAGTAWRTLGRQDGCIYEIVLSAAARSAATRGDDGAVRVWDIQDGEAIVLPGPSSGFTSVAFSADGRRVVAGASDGVARVWDVAPELLYERLERATSLCLPAAERVEYLGEDRVQAIGNERACENKRLGGARGQ